MNSQPARREADTVTATDLPESVDQIPLARYGYLDIIDENV